MRIVLDAELLRNPDSDRREDAEALLTFAKQADGIVVRARDLQTHQLLEGVTIDEVIEQIRSR